MADGNAAIWGAARQVWSEAAEQRCWNHEMRNVLEPPLSRRAGPGAPTVGGSLACDRSSSAWGAIPTRRRWRNELGRTKTSLAPADSAALGGRVASPGRSPDTPGHGGSLSPGSVPGSRWVARFDHAGTCRAGVPPSPSSCHDPDDPRGHPHHSLLHDLDGILVETPLTGPLQIYPLTFEPLEGLAFTSTDPIRHRPDRVSPPTERSR